MSQYWILAAILLPVLGGIFIYVLPFRNQKYMHIFTESVVLATSVTVWSLIAGGSREILYVFRFVNDISISFRVDGMTMIFAGLISVLWPLATLYAFEYMEHEQRENSFFMFYTMTYGITLGIAFASDIVTMYSFYELLTLITVPLVMHTLTKSAVRATRKYLYYSIGGAAFALMSVIFIMVYGDTCQFALGGVLSEAARTKQERLLLWIYVFSFMGFGVKAAIWPMSSWLPDAGVAPTPVTALLHAVAVVNAGAFAIIRLTYYCFGIEFLSGTWAQYAVMAAAMFTIIYGCSRAVKETHIKRRLAWSTVGNLSYILFGVSIMTPLGMAGALTHFVFHGFMKMCSFLCAGAFMHQTGKSRIYEMDGMGRRMKKVFSCFTVSALGLMGVPGFAGFISKWNLTKAAVESENRFAYFGIVCLMISALLTAVYMLTVSVRAVLPGRGFVNGSIREIHDPGWRMCLPLIFCAVCVVLLGCFSQPFVRFFCDVANGTC